MILKAFGRSQVFGFTRIKTVMRKKCEAKPLRYDKMVYIVAHFSFFLNDMIRPYMRLQQ